MNREWSLVHCDQLVLNLEWHILIVFSCDYKIKVCFVYSKATRCPVNALMGGAAVIQ